MHRWTPPGWGPNPSGDSTWALSCGLDWRWRWTENCSFGWWLLVESTCSPCLIPAESLCSPDILGGHHKDPWVSVHRTLFMGICIQDVFKLPIIYIAYKWSLYFGFTGEALNDQMGGVGAGSTFRPSWMHRNIGKKNVLYLQFYYDKVRTSHTNDLLPISW